MLLKTLLATQGKRRSLYKITGHYSNTFFIRNCSEKKERERKNREGKKDMIKKIENWYTEIRMKLKK